MKMKRSDPLQGGDVTSSRNGNINSGSSTAISGGGGGGGNCSGRLGAAVQRAMAMRERHSSSSAEDIKGIGGMRDVYISWLNRSPPNDGKNITTTTVACCTRCGGYGFQTPADRISPPAIEPHFQSRKYTRFCADEHGFSATEYQDLGTEDPRVCGGCSSVGDLGANPAAKKKSFITHVCRQLLALRRKSFSSFE